MFSTPETSVQYSSGVRWPSPKSFSFVNTHTHKTLRTLALGRQLRVILMWFAETKPTLCNPPEIRVRRLADYPCSVLSGYPLPAFINFLLDSVLKIKPDARLFFSAHVKHCERLSSYVVVNSALTLLIRWQERNLVRKNLAPAVSKIFLFWISSVFED